MITADDALARLLEISDQFEAFCSTHGKVSESDTRAKVIDAVLRDVCGWPEAGISREDRSDAGFIDYSLTLPSRRTLIVEAKREGIAFTFPLGNPKRLKLNGSLTSDNQIRNAIRQVREYCDDTGTRYAIATNGYAWIVFRAVRDDIPWREGSARVFPSLDAIRENFTEFWNLLSYEAVASGSLDQEFGIAGRIDRRLLRVGDRLYNADLPLQRNRLNAQLTPLITSIFSEIADQDQVEILEKCYVHSASLRIVAADLDAIIDETTASNIVMTDAIPEFLLNEGARPLPKDETGGGFSEIITRAMQQSSGELFLVLGGIGSGKTTFAKSYQRTNGKSLLDSKTIWFNVDFLKAPLDPGQLEAFVFADILQQLRERYVTPHLETRRNLKRVFSDKISVLRETSLRGLRVASDEYENALNPYLESWSSNLAEYVPGLLREAKGRRGLAVVVFVDNVDQLAPSYQAAIFLLAERLTRLVGSVTIVSLREESYYVGSVQRTFTAYANRKFHIASPRFRIMIANRIDYALNVLQRQDDAMRVILRGGIEFDLQAISDFLQIVKRSVFQKNTSISKFIEAICFGNMRLALQMFTTFLTSGATDVDKMLLIYRREGSYYVAFHEFVKSIMLGDRKYYRETQSPILNLFDCGTERNSSHFTAVRIIQFLQARRGENTVHGQGYVPIGVVVSAFEDTFDNTADVLRTMDRLIVRQLVEVNTRSTESLEGAEFVRLTASGWYYVGTLMNSFAYLDLVLQDTPIDDEDLVERLRQSVGAVDNLADYEEHKVERVETRFARVDMFLDYLSNEETAESERFGLGATGAFSAHIADGIRANFDEQRKWIRRRIRENREQDEDDLVVSPSDMSN